MQHADLEDCRAATRGGSVKSGVYQLMVGGQIISAFCNNGYVTIQRRYDGSLRFDKLVKNHDDQILVYLCSCSIV